MLCNFLTNGEETSSNREKDLPTNPERTLLLTTRDISEKKRGKKVEHTEGKRNKEETASELCDEFKYLYGRTRTTRRGIKRKELFRRTKDRKLWTTHVFKEKAYKRKKTSSNDKRKKAL